jgi:hypothetical protein
LLLHHSDGAQNNQDKNEQFNKQGEQGRVEILLAK